MLKKLIHPAQLPWVKVKPVTGAAEIARLLVAVWLHPLSEAVTVYIPDMPIVVLAKLMVWPEAVKLLGPVQV